MVKLIVKATLLAGLVLLAVSCEEDPQAPVNPAGEEYKEPRPSGGGFVPPERCNPAPLYNSPECQDSPWNTPGKDDQQENRDRLERRDG